MVPGWKGGKRLDRLKQTARTADSNETRGKETKRSKATKRQ